MEFTNEVAAIIIIGIETAVITEILKHTQLNEKLSGRLVDLLTLTLGLAGGITAMYITGGPFAEYVWIGLSGAAWSTKIYEIVENWTKGNVTKKVGE